MNSALPLGLPGRCPMYPRRHQPAVPVSGTYRHVYAPALPPSITTTKVRQLDLAVSLPQASTEGDTVPRREPASGRPRARPERFRPESPCGDSAEIAAGLT